MRPPLVRLALASAVITSAAIVASTHAAAINLTAGAGNNFDSLSTSTGVAGSWVQESTLPGWSIYFVTSAATSGGAVTDANLLNASAGASSTGGLYSWGPVGVAERALGSIASDGITSTQGTGFARPSIYYVLRLVNDTGSDIDSLTVGYTGEQWRSAASQTNTQDLTFQYY